MSTQANKSDILKQNDWLERAELRHWLLDAVAPQAMAQMTEFRLTTSDGVHWLAMAMRGEGETVHVKMYSESSTDASHRTHEWDVKINNKDLCWPLGSAEFEVVE